MYVYLCVSVSECMCEFVCVSETVVGFVHVCICECVCVSVYVC